MELLLKRDHDGTVLAGSDKDLLERAARGDDLCVYIDAPGYDETIAFGGHAVDPWRVSALSLQHLAHGDLADSRDLDRSPMLTSHYIYDSLTNNVLVKESVNGDSAETTVFTNNPYYRSYAWYSSRRFVEAGFSDLDELKARGDQFKVRLDLSPDLRIVFRPDIIYFPYQVNQYLVKSAGLLLPTAWVSDPAGYAAAGQAITSAAEYSLAYLNIADDDGLTIIYQERYRADRRIDDHISQGSVPVDAGAPARVTRVHCRHTLLVPEDS